MKRRIVFSIAAVLAVFTVAAQPEVPDKNADTVFAPFVSHLAVEVKDDVVKLTWMDSRDAAGSVLVFRSTQPITADKLKAAKQVAQVPFGAQSYIDRPGPGSWHYFVAATSDSGSRYDIVIPYGNIASAAVQVKQGEEVPTGAVPSTGSSFASISARVQGDAIVVSFSQRAETKSVLLYRSAQPMERIQDLLDAVIVLASSATSPFVDYPVPGIRYYYAIVAEEELKSGNITLIPGRNVTTVAVEVPAGRYRVGLPGPQTETRSMPLPLIAVESALPFVSTGAPEESSLTPAAAKAVAELMPKQKTQKKTEKSPKAFPQDLEAPGGGEEYTLRSIVQGPFAKRNWEEATEQLASYISLPRKTATEARARYYLGQSYYFSGQLREALFEFLLAQSQYAAESGEWIQAILPQLSVEENYQTKVATEG